MKATICVQYGPPSTAFEYKENYAKPEITKPNQILIKNKFCSVNPADCKQRSGNLKLVLKNQFPFILCQDFAGVVVEVGKDVKKFQVGDNVFGCTNGAENGKQPRNSCAAEYVTASPSTEMPASYANRHSGATSRGTGCEVRTATTAQS